jgi:hypothetical protein
MNGDQVRSSRRLVGISHIPSICKARASLPQGNYQPSQLPRQAHLHCSRIIVSSSETLLSWFMLTRALSISGNPQPMGAIPSSHKSGFSNALPTHANRAASRGYGPELLDALSVQKTTAATSVSLSRVSRTPPALRGRGLLWLNSEFRCGSLTSASAYMNSGLRSWMPSEKFIVLF